LAVKNVGTGAVEAIVEAQKAGVEFESFEDFFQRVDLRQVNRKVLESLIKAGAFDGFSTESTQRSRPNFLLELDGAMARSTKMREEAQSGQDSLFGWDEMAAPKAKAGASSKPGARGPGADSRVGWSEHELLACEKEVLGFYLSGHPLARFQTELNLFSSCRLSKLPSSGSVVRIAGMLSNVRRLVTKAKKEPYARCRFEDLESEVDLIIFPKAYAGGISQHLKPSEMVVVTGKVNRRAEDGTPEILVEEMVPLAQAREQYVSELFVNMSSPSVAEGVLEDLKDILSRYPGRCRVCLEVQTPPEGSVVVETEVTVKPTAELFEEIEKRLGHESWKITKIGR
jgi:DNA polymerase-3 subunit alpha